MTKSFEIFKKRLTFQFQFVPTQIIKSYRTLCLEIENLESFGNIKSTYLRLK